MKKYFAGAVLVLGFFLSVTGANAQATNNSELLKSLLAQLASLQQQLAVLLARNATSPNQFCATFSNDLRFGDGGLNGMARAEDVKNLYAALQKEGFAIDDRGAFGESTAAAVVAFQAKYGISPTGYVGPVTRTKLNALYGCAAAVSSSPSQPVISIVAPQNLVAGDTGTWQVKINYPTNSTSNTSFYAVWGDEQTAPTYFPYKGPNTTSGADDSAKFFHAYQTPGKYSPAFVVINKFGELTRAVSSITIGSPVLGTLGILYPQGGVVLENSKAKNSGIIASIQWKSSGLGDIGVDIDAISDSGFAKAIAVNATNTGKFSWKYDAGLPEGDYKLQIAPHGKSVPVAASGYFTVVGDLGQ